MATPKGMLPHRPGGTKPSGSKKFSSGNKPAATKMGRLSKNARPPSREAKKARIAKAGFAKDTPTILQNFAVGAGGTGH